MFGFDRPVMQRKGVIMNALPKKFADIPRADRKEKDYVIESNSNTNLLLDTRSEHYLDAWTDLKNELVEQLLEGKKDPRSMEL